jgi:3D (Asp-Asp-Asp) domain-containing protein
MRNNKRLAVLLLIVFMVGIFCIGKLLIEIETLEEELEIANHELGIARSDNERLRLQFDSITIEDLLGSPEGWKVVGVIATAYAPLDNKSGICADDNPNVTATGTKPSRGTIAVNPNLIPYNSKMVIIGDSWIMEGIALDTGGRMRQEVYWIDIFHEDYISAMNFGKQEVIVFFREAD